MDHILKMEDIDKAFPGVVALDKMSLHLERGRIMALLGENGAGKSTLIKILSGAYAPDGGRIILDGEQYSSMTPAKAIAAGVSVIYQELNLVPHLSVCENIFLGREPLKNGFIDKGKMFEQTREILDSLGISISPGTLVKNLSVGFQQLVEVAKAIARNAKVLVLDEPTSALSNAETQNLFEILRGLRARGVSMIYISHRLEEVFEICDCAAVMRDGVLVGVTEIAETNREELIGMMVGRTLSETFPGGNGAHSREVMLKVENLCGGPVKDISFELYKGEILGFAGLVGAGRTETARVLFGADEPDSGKILIGGKPVKIKNPADAIAAGIGFIPEDRKRQGLNLIASISDNIAVANLDSLKSGPLLSSKKERALVNKYVEYLSIKTPSIYKKTVELSGGNQQKVVLAKWLARRCRVLILDEPTRGVDVGGKQEIYRLMRRLTDQGISILMISSEMPELLGMSDRIAVMHGYKIKNIYERGEFSQERILDSASGGNG